MKLHEKEIVEMNYDTVDLFKIDPSKKYAENPKYQKAEKQKSVMRLD